MTFSWDFNTATLMAIIMQAVLLIVFLVKTANTAKSAMQRAKDATKIAEEAHEKIAILTGSLALHREQVAREYPDREDLRELKERIDRLNSRIDEVLDHWSKN